MARAAIGPPTPSGRSRAPRTGSRGDRLVLVGKNYTSREVLSLPPAQFADRFERSHVLGGDVVEGAEEPDAVVVVDESLYDASCIIEGL
jgi:hypothetical protein